MTELVQYNPTPLAEIEKMAEYAVRSQMFGKMTKEQATVLMMLSQAEGAHPMIAARDFDIIQNKPAKKAEAMLRDFLKAGGSVDWHQLDDTKADATFSHPQGGSYRCIWDMDRAKKAGLGDKENWTKWRRQMLRSRCVSEGCKTVYPAATSGMYTTEEVRDMEPMRDVTPVAKVKRVTDDPLANQIQSHTVTIGQASAPSPQQTPASPEVDPPSRGAFPDMSQYPGGQVTGHQASIASTRGAEAALVLNFINADGQVIEITNRPAFLSAMEAVFIAAEPEAALDCFFANQAILNDFQSVAFDRHEKAKTDKARTDARAVLDRVNAVFETAKELQKAMKS